MRKLLIVIGGVFAVFAGFLFGVNSDRLVANALANALAIADIEYSIPLTVTMLADIEHRAILCRAKSPHWYFSKKP